MATSTLPTNAVETLPARPPTPPREATNDADASLKSVPARSIPFDPQRSLQTPPSVVSEAQSALANPGSSRTRKKVEWSNKTDYREPLNVLNGERTNKLSPPSAPSSASSKPIKGILKPSPSPNPTASLHAGLEGAAGHANIAEMLDSTIKHLAGSDRDCKIDAYMMLSRALKASNNLPDRVALQSKMSLFTQFIQRDITVKNSSGSLDVSLINHAITLLVTFLHFPAIASTLTSDFGVFLIDHTIRSFEDNATPKDVARHLMQAVAFQNFSPKVMTLDRVGRLIAALTHIEDRIRGKSIVMGRTQVYRRLVKQTKLHMAVHGDWLRDMFTDMLSAVRDIRTQAIALGTEAGFALRSEKQLLRKAAEVFQTVDKDGQIYIEFYMNSLAEMVKQKQCPSAVPEIWSVLTLFMRCPLDRWQYYGPWLRLAQSAFNTTNGQTQEEANHAWDRYMYLSLTDSRVTATMLRTLLKPLLFQLQRKRNNKQAGEIAKLRRPVIGGICTLFYYSFRPGNSKPNLAGEAHIWDLIVEPIISQLTGTGDSKDTLLDGQMQAGRILTGLLDSSTPRLWREDRIMERPPVKPDELPAIDAKWVRHNCDKVFHITEPILLSKFVDLASKDSMAYRLWSALVGSVASASAKEIKVSDDTIKFLAQSFGLLSKVWSSSEPAQDGVDGLKFLTSVANYLQLLVDSLGLLPFTEKKLVMMPSKSFEALVASSQQPCNPEGVVRSPLHHLFMLLSSLPPNQEDDGDFSDFFMSVFQPFLASKSIIAQRDLLREMLQLLPRNALCPFAPWDLAASVTQVSLDLKRTRSSTPGSDNAKFPGPEYREIVVLLDRGITSHPSLPTHHWYALFDSLSQQVAEAYGDAGRALAVIEPLAKALLDGTQDAGHKPAVNLARALFSIATLPNSQQAVDVVRSKLWGTPISVGRAGPADPFSHLYKLGNIVLKSLYQTASSSSLDDEVALLFGALTAFLARSFSQAKTDVLVKLQEGLCLWFRDESEHLHLGDGSPMSQSFIALCETVCTGLTAAGTLARNQLDDLEPLLTASFRSQHRPVVSKMIQTWNVMFEITDQVDCSDSLKSVVISSHEAHEKLPSTESEDRDFGAQVTEVMACAETMSLASPSTGTPRTHSLASKLSPRAPLKSVGETPPTSARRKSLRRTTKPRLRHDDSQIHFESIQSLSPIKDDSQHLTDRQREVRERQLEHAGLYSGIHSSSPQQQPQTLSPEAAAPSPSRNPTPQPKATPEHRTSYEDIISSTPTPRRGQVLHLDDDNDPPSSPPEPRPYPLLSEIQSRSRASSARSLENWEFSSPAGSPVTSRQQAQEIELPGLEPLEELMAPLSDLNPTPADNDVSSVPEVIPSSLPEAGRASVRSLDDAPLTPQHSRKRARSKDILVEKKSSDSRAESGRSSRKRSRSSARREEPAPSVDDSFVLGTADERSFMRVMAEIDHRPDEVISPKEGSTKSKKKAKRNRSSDACITVQQDDSPSQARRARKSKRASSTIPSTPAAPRAPSAELEKKKRKRSGSASRQTAEPSAKRRSVERSSPVSEPPSRRGRSRNTPRASRRSTRASTKEKRPVEEPEPVPSPAKSPEPPAPEVFTLGSEADTDEEVMSQLFNESHYSESQRAIQDDEPADLPVPDMEMGDEPGEVEPQPDHGEVVMASLRGGLTKLKGLSLSRQEMNNIEDMLFDFKRELYEAERRGRDQ